MQFYTEFIQVYNEIDAASEVSWFIVNTEY